MKPLSLVTLLSLALLVGCAGTNSFPNRVAPGETVAVSAGWKHHFARDNITVTITPEGQAAIPVSPDRVRASIHTYPDPLSSIVLSGRTGSDISGSSSTYSNVVSFLTGDDPDWWQNVLFVDIPAGVGIPVGLADITVTNPEGETATTKVRIVDPDPVYGGAADSFDAQFLGPIDDLQFTAMERVDHYVVSFSGTVIPYAIQLDLAYTDLTGVVVNPSGLYKSVFWNDNAGAYRVILTPVSSQAFQNFQDLKFYVAVTAGSAASADLSLVPGSLHAFDQDGAPISDPSVNVALIRGAAGLE